MKSKTRARGADGRTDKEWSDMHKQKCDFCIGAGFWPFGDLCAIGPMDGREWGKKVIKCPSCGAGFVDKGERWDILVSHYSYKILTGLGFKIEVNGEKYHVVNPDGKCVFDGKLEGFAMFAKEMKEMCRK